jgi:hypothetical protein
MDTQRLCDIEKCNNKHKANGWCNKHLKRWVKTGDPLGLIYKGFHTAPDGYVKVRINNKTLLQHRVIMAEHLGRELLASENVHHINGDRADNRIENLEIWDTRQPKGQRIPDKIEYAVEILKQYAPHLLKET